MDTGAEPYLLIARCAFYAKIFLSSSHLQIFNIFSTFNSLKPQYIAGEKNHIKLCDVQEH